MKLSSHVAPVAALLVALSLPAALGAATISGTAIDKTTNKPAAGDTAVLLDLQQGMTESGRTTVDGSGHFSFNVPNTTGMHLVRVDHDKAEYYGPVPPNATTVNVDVFDVAPKVDGLHLYADVERMETDQQGLSVTESFFIRNESNPPKTQLSAHPFVFYLPAGAQLEGATAMGPGGMAVANTPVPVPGGKNEYSFVFPIRPGETRFQLGYHMPYTGSADFHARVSIPAENLAVMLPKSMKLSGSGFQPLKDDAGEPGVQTWLANNVDPASAVSFTVSGTGSIPRNAQNAQAGGGQGAAGSPGMGGTDQSAEGGGAPDQSAQPGRPGGGLGNPIDTPDPLQKYKWWIISGMGLALVIAAAFILRSKPGHAAAAPAVPPKGTLPPALTPTPLASSPHPVRSGPVAAVPLSANGSAHGGSVLTALKDELFALETDRLAGRLSETEYAEQRAALEVMLKRALARETVSRQG